MRWTVLLLGFLVASSAACNNPFGLLPASIHNKVDTLELFAINGTAVDQPSAYVLAGKDNSITHGRYRLGFEPLPFSGNFDFIYRIDPTAGPVLVPFGAVAPVDSTASGLPGFLTPTQSFDDIVEAEQSGYTVNRAIPVVVGTVLMVRSGLPNGCFLGIPYYAKLQVISVDRVKRSVIFQILVDTNCGYRGLELGLPSR